MSAKVNSQRSVFDSALVSLVQKIAHSVPVARVV